MNWLQDFFAWLPTERERVVTIVGVLQPVVLLDCPCVRQMHLVAGIHQPVHKPIPVVCRLHRDALDLFLERFQEFQDQVEIVADHGAFTQPSDLT